MKRLILVGVMILYLAPLMSLAEHNLASRELFPAEGENGKWGYVNHEGTFVIQPAFDHAFGFRGNYAEVVVFPDDYTGDRNPYHCGYSGIIDRDGVFFLEPVYTIDAGYDEMFFGGRDTGIWCIRSGKTDPDNQLDGWFDIGSGYFSGLVWESVWGWISDDRLIPVTDETHRAGYADRTTGELVIPCRYQSVDPSPFYGGVASVSLEEEEFDETGNRACSGYFLINETGAEISLPERIFAVPYEGAHDGLIMVSDHEDAKNIYPNDGETLFGFVNVQGDVVITPQFIDAHHFSEGSAAVRFPEGDWGYIDPMGFVLERGLPREPVEYEYEDELGFDMEEGSEVFVEETTDVLFSEDGSVLLRYSSNNKSKKYCVPEGVETIGEGAFAYDHYLETVILPKTLLYIADKAFYGSSVKYIDIQEGLLEIGNRAFHNSQLKEITLPQTLVRIGSSAFEGCWLEQVSLPPDLSVLGTFAFFGNPIPENAMIELPASLAMIGADVFWFGDGRNFIYLVHQNSYALDWVKENNYDYEIIDE